MKRKINKKMNYVSFSLIVSIIITIIEIYNAYNPYISYFKMGEGNKSIKIACVSDVHYKTTGYKANLTKMVKLINEVKPDITVLLGDIIDAKTKDIDKEYFVNNINNIKSRYGVYAVIGNHELNYNSLDEIKNIYLIFGGIIQK